MKTGDAIEMCNALRECAAAVELELHAAVKPDELDAGHLDLELSVTLRGALLELALGLGGVAFGGFALGNKVMVELSDRELGILSALGGEKPPSEVLRYLVASICDGVRRPGSWERGCVTQLFGHDRTIDAEAEIEDSYQGPPYREVD